MAISDIYVVQHLLTETSATFEALCWRELENGGYAAERNGTSLHLSSSHSRTGSRLFLTVSCGLYKTHIAEPQSTGVLRARYAEPDDERLAALLHELQDAVVAQCTRRERAARESAARIREAIFQRLVFGKADDPLADRLALTCTDVR
jgi:hypothetical protein